MIVGFSKHGRGAAAAAVDYLTKGDGRETAPTVLFGDPELVQQRVEQNPNEWKYTSGVLSFAPEDIVTEAQERELIAEFEETAFSGIDPENRPQGLWVRHEHAGHHELHFLYSRQLNDDRAYNMRPPGDQARWDAFRDKWNYTQGWADPDDPRRARDLSLPDHILKAGKSEDLRKLVHDWATNRIEAGTINNRAELVQQLQEEGLNVPRQSKNHITIEAGGERVRLKGAYFGESFQSRAAVEGQLGERTADYQRNLSGKIARAGQRLEQFNAKRAEQNQSRFGKANKTELVAKHALQCHDLRRFLDGELGLGRMASPEVRRSGAELGRGSKEVGSRAERAKGRYLDAGPQQRSSLGENDRQAGHDRARPVGGSDSGELSLGRLNPARERIAELRKAISGCIGRTKQSAADRKRAVIENVPRAAKLIGGLGERVEQLKTAVRPALAKIQQKVRLKARSVSRGMGLGM